MRVIADYGLAARSNATEFHCPEVARWRPSDATAVGLHGSARRWTSCSFRQSCGKRPRGARAAGASRPQGRACAHPFARRDANHQPVDRATKRRRWRRRSVASDAAEGGDRTIDPRDAGEAGQLDRRHRGGRHERVMSASDTARPAGCAGAVSREIDITAGESAMGSTFTATASVDCSPIRATGGARAVFWARTRSSSLLYVMLKPPIRNSTRSLIQTPAK